MTSDHRAALTELLGFIRAGENPHASTGMYRSGEQARYDAALSAAIDALPAAPGDTILTLTLDAESVAYLGVLAHSDAMGANATPKDVVKVLVHAAVDGVRRPGAWEREWLTPAFGDDWRRYTAQHPTVSYFVVPRDEPGDPPPGAERVRGALALAFLEYDAFILVGPAVAKRPDGSTVELPGQTQIVERKPPRRRKPVRGPGGAR